MRFRDYLRLSFRSLRRSRLRSGLTIAAIVVGATGITIMLTFVTSVKNYVVDQFVQSGQNLQIQVAASTDLTYSATGQVHGNGPGGPGQKAALTPAVEANIAAIPHVTGAAATFENFGPGLDYLAYGGKQLSAQRIIGFEPNGVIRPTLVAGRNLAPTDATGVVLLSKDYANALGFSADYGKLVGQTVLLHTRAGYTGAGANLPSTLPPQNQCQPNQQNCLGGPTSGLPAIDLRAQVLGVVGGEDGQGSIILPLPWVLDLSNQSQPQDVQYEQPRGPQGGQPGQPQPPQPPQPPQQPSNRPAPGPGTVRGGWTRQDPAQFVANNGGFSSLLVNVDNADNVAAVATQVDRLGLHAATGLAELSKKKDAANIIAVVLGSLGLVALAIAALGIMNTMVMSVLERTREIGVMRAVGARGATIRRLFTFEAAMLGFFGGLLGVILGSVFVAVAQPVIRSAVKSGDLSNTNFSVPPWLIVVVIAGTTFIGLVSGLVPSRRAARLDPVEALRYE